MNKPLSMTPSAIRKREQRAAAKNTTVLYVGGVNITAKREHEANFVGPVAPGEPQLSPVGPQAAPEPAPAAPKKPSSGMSVLVVGHAFIKGKGHDKPKKDSLWGILQDGQVFVKFFGRRDGALRFKIADSKDEALQLYQLKLAGKDVKKLVHVDLTPSKQVELLGSDWPRSMFAKYMEAKANKAVDDRKYQQ